MQITLAVTAPTISDQEDILVIEVEPAMTVAQFKTRIEFQTSYPPATQKLYYSGRELIDDTKTLEQCQITPDSMLAMHVRNPQAPTNVQGGSRAAQGGRNQEQQEMAPKLDPEMIRLQALGNPGALAQIRNVNPELADAIQDPARFRRIFESMDLGQRQRNIDAEKEREIARLNADPFNIEAQTRMEELIRQERVQENMERAAEYYPESFGKVHMLYIPVEVNGQMLKAFVDSGAQETIMSPSCAEKCGIMRLLDTRFAGIARGVGTAKILGRVHSAQIKIGTMFLPCSFIVMEGKQIDLLLGLNMLKRYQANIDLKKGALVIQGAEVPFLGEAEIPKEEEEDAAILDAAKKSSVTGATTGPISDTPSQSGPGSAQTGSSAAQMPLSTPGPASFPPVDIAKLTDLGFSREEAIQALEISGGNVDAAAGFLL